ncbi:MAG: cupin domain-containing protein [Candidatus Bathyarchaeia archaeon]
MSIRIRKLVEEPGEELKEEGYEGVNSVWVSLKRDDLEAFSSRLMRIDPGGHIGLHVHDREHIAVVIRGGCVVETGESGRAVGEGSIVTIPGGVPHRFVNDSDEKLALFIMNFYVESEEVQA